MKALISFLTFLTCSLCCYSQSSVTGAPQMVMAPRATFNDIISIGEVIKVDTTLRLEDRLADIAFGRKLANMSGMRRRKCETCTRYLVKRVGQ